MRQDRLPATRTAPRAPARLAIEHANAAGTGLLNVNAEYGQHELARTIAAHAYRRGAKFVDVWYFDPFVKRARIEHADEATLDYVPHWYAQRALGLGELHGAHISIAGGRAPSCSTTSIRPALADLLPRVKENFGVINDKTTNWLVMPGPTEGWARQVYRDDDDLLGRLWAEIAFVTRPTPRTWSPRGGRGSHRPARWGGG